MIEISIVLLLAVGAFMLGSLAAEIMTYGLDYVVNKNK